MTHFIGVREIPPFEGRRLIQVSAILGVVELPDGVCEIISIFGNFKVSNSMDAIREAIDKAPTV